MNPLQRMELHKGDFTQNDLLIYQAVLQNPTLVTYKSTSDLAREYGVSQPALSRFVKAMGYSRYQDFRSEMTAFLALQTEQDAQSSGHLGYFNNLYRLLQETEKVLTTETLQDLAQYVAGFDRVYTAGYNKSYQPAHLFEILMRKISRSIHAVPRDFLSETCDYADPHDLVMVFSLSGASGIMEEVAETKAKVMLITANPRHHHPECVDRLVLLPYVTTDPELSAVSPVLFDIFVELLVSQLSRLLNPAPPADSD